MRVTKYTFDFDPRYDVLIVPIWVSFPGLPPYLHHQDALFAVAVLLGTPIRLDTATKNFASALSCRVCIEMDVLKELLPKIHIQSRTHQFFQNVIYEDVPLFCATCCILVHNIGDCRKLPWIIKVIDPAKI